MELIRKTQGSSQHGMSMIELLIAILVLSVGVLSSVVLIPLSIGSNWRNRQQSNSTVLAQMMMEKISSQAASSSTSLTITDCAGTANTVSTAGSAGGSGASLLSSGDVDFSKILGSAGAPTGYYMLFKTCGTAGRQVTYDVRWNIRTPSTYVKLITISVRLKNTSTRDPNIFSLPVTIRSMAGQGS